MLRLAVLTARGHPYGNTVLRDLADRDAFAGWETTVLEQDWLIPGLGRWRALARYARCAGAHYLCAKAFQQALLRLRSIAVTVRRQVDDPFFPYQRLVALQRIRLQGFRDAGPLGVLRNLKPDLILSIFSREILPSSVLSLPSLGCFNLHPSPLPLYRGVSPTFRALAEKAERWGVTLYRMDRGIDTGDLFAREEVPLDGIRTEHALYLACAHLCAGLAARLLERLRRGEGLPPPLEPWGEPSYRALPTRTALRALRDNGFALYRVGELLR